MRQRGFTLVELVVVIIISGILSLAAMQFITRPIDIYVDQSRRARLVEQSLSAMHRLARDVRLSVPNSIRVGCGGQCVELMRAVTGARYRALPPGDVLSFLPADADTSFEVIGNLGGVSDATTSIDPQACERGTGSCVVIYNTGFSGSDLWHGDNSATLVQIGSGATTSVRFDNSRFTGGVTAFPAQSPGQRFYITDTAVTFLCDTDTESLRRYWGYSRRSDQADVDTHEELTTLANPAESALVANGVSGCRFNYSAGTPTRNAVLSVRLTFSEQGETITLLEQFSVSNLP